MAFPSSRAFGRALMAAAKTTVAAAASTTTKAAARSTNPSGPPRGFTIPKPVSPALAEFARPLALTPSKGFGITSKPRVFRTPEDKREIICDEKLKALFGKEKIGFSEIGKLLSGHFQRTG